MGIPSYFSYIIKNYSNIIRKHRDCDKIQHLLMDCNSVIYDTFRELEEKYNKTPFDLSTIENKLIDNTIQKIVEYIVLISPEKSVYVTFDGVAPFAKMNQQRIRRYNSQFSESTPIWNTMSITPGTHFMKTLSNRVTTYFRKYRVANIAVQTSCSDEPGEGEQKMFEMVRKNKYTTDIIGVYGLDADLIMLSLFHQQFCNNIYVFREAPNFKTVISSQFDDKEVLFMDIQSLSNSIFQEMGNYDPADKQMRVTDYMFMCFLLGNDFLPHLPSINIRIHGIQMLTDTYYQTIGRFRDRSLIHRIKKTIHWKWVKIFFNGLADIEHRNLLLEHEKIEKDRRPAKNEEIPYVYRVDERYINPNVSGWQQRYYRRLLEIEDKEDIKCACIQYLKGLSWVYNYYTKGQDNGWDYRKTYGPLLKDIVRNIDSFQEESPIKINPVTPMEQMLYVLPKKGLYLLGDDYEIKIGNIANYKDDCECDISYKRYMWERHPKLPHVS